MKAFVVVSALAAVASASMQAHVYSDNACKSEIPLEHNEFQSPTDCVAAKTPINVAPLNKKFTYLRQSHVVNEVLLFEDYTTCVAYPTTFDRNQQVAFVRAETQGQCTPCYQCGDIKAVNFQTTSTQSAASSTVPAVLSALVIAGVSTLFL